MVLLGPISGLHDVCFMTCLLACGWPRVDDRSCRVCGGKRRHLSVRHVPEVGCGTGGGLPKPGRAPQCNTDWLMTISYAFDC